jgi:hypothetical protein
MDVWSYGLHVTETSVSEEALQLPFVSWALHLTSPLLYILISRKLPYDRYLQILAVAIVATPQAYFLRQAFLSGIRSPALPLLVLLQTYKFLSYGLNPAVRDWPSGRTHVLALHFILPVEVSFSQLTKLDVDHSIDI